MYLGKLCEVGGSEALYERPAHHYTRLLVDSIPVPDPTVPARPMTIDGDPPSPVLPPTGCRFHPRCPAATELCRATAPTMAAIGDDHFVACHFPLIDADSATPVTLG